MGSNFWPFLGWFIDLQFLRTFGLFNWLLLDWRRWIWFNWSSEECWGLDWFVVDFCWTLEMRFYLLLLFLSNFNGNLFECLGLIHFRSISEEFLKLKSIFGDFCKDLSRSRLLVWLNSSGNLVHLIHLTLQFIWIQFSLCNFILETLAGNAVQSPNLGLTKSEDGRISMTTWKLCHKRLWNCGFDL